MILFFSKSTQNLISKKIKISLLMVFLFALMSNNNGVSQKQSESWASQTLASMTLREKIGQLFMVAAYSNKPEAHKNELIGLIKEYNIGGLIFFQGGPVRQALLNNEFQSNAKIPLFMAMDAEWGLAMRIDSSVKYPRQMTLGAIRDKSLIYEMGKQIAVQSRRIGMQINFAPVVDVNVNVLNPVIGTRAFGENKEEVASRAIQYMNGMQDQRVLACAKHFPGHGDTDTDSHLDIPIIKHSRERLDDVELYPFKEIFKEDVKSVMVAHINIPVLDNAPKKPTTLSYDVVTKLLKEEMGFKGLAFTDALNMKGVANYDAPGMTDLMALKAGNDVLLYPMDVPKAIDMIEKAVLAGEIELKDLDAHVLKILEAKEWSNIKDCQFVEMKNLYQDLNKSEYEALNYKLRASALTLLKMNTNFPLPLKQNLKVLNINVGTNVVEFNEVLGRYTNNVTKLINKNSINQTLINHLSTECNDYDYVVLTINDLSNDTKSNFGVTPAIKTLVAAIGSREKTITCLYGNPYCLKDFEMCSNLILGYENHEYAHRAMAQAVVGSLNLDGVLPVSSGRFRQGDGIIFMGNGLLGFDFPSNNGLDPSTLTKIDSIVKAAINAKATPGCQVMVCKDGKVVFEKNYGFTTYEKTKPVTSDVIYDLASVTKVLATGMALMRLDGEGKFDITKQLKDYLPELESTNKGDLYIKDILAHQSGLVAYIPHWSKTVENGKPMDFYYSKKQDDVYTLAVAENLFAKPLLQDSIYKWSNESALQTKGKDGKYAYKYSDVGYYYMLKIVEKLSGQPIDQYLTSQIYSQLNLQKMGYQPLNRFSKKDIAPTEKDTYFRNQLIQGYVHDQGAAMMGGVAGHAGLFSNAFDVAQILQMTLENGNYNNCHLIDGQIVCNYTAKQLTGDNRKGATWDRMRAEGQGSSSDYASELSYGHSGFTGTLVWVDPDYNLVYVFLSNRVYTDASNNELLRTDVRSKIQDVIYESMLNYNRKNSLYQSLDKK